MVVAVLTLLCVLCILYIVHMFFDKADIIKSIVLSVSVFSFLFVIVSGLYFAFDVFSFYLVLFTILAPAVFFAARDMIRKRKFSMEFASVQNSEMLVQLGLIILTFALTFVKFELYCNGQDQGLYQAEAMELYMGNYEVEHDFPEYNVLTSHSDKETYYKMLTQTLVGYYPLSASPIAVFDKNERISDVSGMYHGVQTFPAVLALSAKMFGLRNMMQVQTIFLICSVLLLYYALCKLGISMGRRFLFLLLFILSPLVLWISKSSFTEMFLTMCICFYLLLLVESDTVSKRLLLALPLLAFAFVHMSFLQLYPAFIVIGVLLYIHFGHKEYLWGNIIVSAGLAVSYFMMDRIAPQYFYNNASRLFFQDIITVDNFLIWVYIGAIVVGVLSLLLFRVKNISRNYNKVIAVSRLLPGTTLVILGFIIRNIILVGYMGIPGESGRIDLTQYYGTGFLPALGHSSLYALAMATGMAVVPFIIIMMVVKFHFFLSNPIKLSISFLFIYFILVQSAFFNKEVYYYYYYSRYQVVYIPVICIMFAILFDCLKKSRIKWAIIGISVCIMAGFDIPLLINKDLTMLEWDCLLDMQEVIEADSAIIMDEEQVLLMGPQLRTLSDSALFPVLDDFEKEVSLLARHYDNIYFLTDDFVIPDKKIVLDDFGVIYRNQYIDQNDMSQGILYPTSFEKEEKEILLYKYQFADSEQIAIDGGKIGVLNGIKKDSYISSTGKSGTVMYGPYISLLRGQYYLKIPIKVLQQKEKSIGNIYIGNVDKGPDFILQSQPLEDFFVKEEGKDYLVVPFLVNGNENDVEFVITATDGSLFRIYSYEIYKMVR